jgi:hypothetical protein
VSPFPSATPTDDQTAAGRYRLWDRSRVVPLSLANSAIPSCRARRQSGGCLRSGDCGSALRAMGIGRSGRRGENHSMRGSAAALNHSSETTLRLVALSSRSSVAVPTTVSAAPTAVLAPLPYVLRLFRTGALRPVLPDCVPQPARIFMHYVSRRQLAARVKAS